MRIIRSVLKKELMDIIKDDNKQFANFPPFIKARNYIKTRRFELTSKVKVSYDIVGFDFKDIYYFDPTFKIKDMIHLITVDTMLFDYKEFIHTERPEVTIRDFLVKNPANITVFGLRNYFSALHRSRGITLIPENFVLKREKFDEKIFPIKTGAPMRYILVKLNQCKGNKYIKFDKSFQDRFTKEENKYIEKLRKEIPKLTFGWDSFISHDRLSGKIIDSLPDKIIDLHTDKFFGKNNNPIELIDQNPQMMLEFTERVIKTYQVPMTTVTHIYIMTLFRKWVKCSVNESLQRYQDLVKISQTQDISKKMEYVEMVVIKEILKIKRVDL